MAGKPQLMLPTTMEQRLTCQRVLQLGAGTIGDPREGKDTVLNLRAVWEQSRYSVAARGVALRYLADSHVNLASVMALITGDISK